MSIDEAGPNDDTLNPYYHSTGDTIDKLNFTKTVEFVKVGFVSLLTCYYVFLTSCRWVWLSWSSKPLEEPPLTDPARIAAKKNDS